MKLKSVWMYLAAAAVLLGVSAAQAQDCYTGREGHMMRLGDRSAQSGSKKSPVHWTNALKKANERLHRRAVFSVLGDDVNTSLRRANAQSRESAKMENLFLSHPNHKQKFMTVQKAMQNNPLFKNYRLTVYDGGDLVYEDKETPFIQEFFAGKRNAAEAFEYKDVILVLLATPNYEPFWFVIHPANQLVTMVYSDSHPLVGMKDLQTPRKPLAVK